MSDCAGAAAGLGSAFATILRSMVMGGTRVVKVSILGVLSGWDGLGSKRVGFGLKLCCL